MTSSEIDTSESRDPREQILSGVRKGHAVTLDAFKTVVDRVAPVTSKVPTVTVPSVRVPRPEKLPYSDKLPGREVLTSRVTGAREFAGQLRDEQRKFNGEFLKTAAGLHPVFSKDTAEEAAEPAEPEIPEGPHGPGSAHPLEDGSSPHPRFHVKGNADSGLYHGTDSPHYGRTGAEVWFESEEAAKAAGYKHWNHRKR